MSALQPVTSLTLERVVRRCLARNPDDRWQTARDLLRELTWLAESDAKADAARATVPQPAVGRRRARAVVVSGLASLTVIAAAAAIAFVAGRLTVATPAAPEVRVHQLTDWTGLEETPAISPDGRSVAFVAGAGGSRQIWLRLIARGGPLQLTRDPGDHLFPRWSPDSNSLLYFRPAAEGAASGALWEVPALGGTPRRIGDGIGAADISHDGAKLAFFRFEAGRVELAVAARDGSAVRPVAQLETGYYYLSLRWSPDDRSIAYFRASANIANIFVVSSAAGTPRQVLPNAMGLEGLSWSPDGSRIIFSSARGATIRYLPTSNLWSVAPDGSHQRQLTFGEATYANPDVSRNGLLVASRWRSQSDIWRIPVGGSPIENVARASRVTQQTSQVFTPSAAPDGTQVAYVSDAGDHANIWVHTVATGERQQITYEQEPDVQVGLPLWSPRGDRVAYFAASGNSNSINYWVVDHDGSNRRLLAPDGIFATWSPDGQWLYFSTGNKLLRKVPATGGHAITIRSDSATRPALSPDGRTLYYLIELPVWTGGADYEVRAASPENGPGRVLARIPARRMPRPLLWHPVISPDGQWLLLALVDEPTSNLWALSTTTGALRRLTDFQGRPTVIVRRAAWAPDGRSVFAAVGERDADIVLIEGLRP
jgi:Tol biopolymer transport system component